MIRPQPVCDPKRMRAQHSPGSIGSTILGRGFFLGAGTGGIGEILLIDNEKH
jgi:hypothetical protein